MEALSFLQLVPGQERSHERELDPGKPVLQGCQLSARETVKHPFGSEKVFEYGELADKEKEKKRWGVERRIRRI